jgi:hypothetical protein
MGPFVFVFLVCSLCDDLCETFVVVRLRYFVCILVLLLIEFRSFLKVNIYTNLHTGE